jgi:uncharacterized protein YcbK (DUF882 family)
MLPVIAQLRTAATLMAIGVPTPVPIAPEIEAAMEPVELELYDVNADTSARVAIRRDGATDDDTAVQLKHLFRCHETGSEHALAPKTLAMLADLAVQYPDKAIEFVSVFRNSRNEPIDSPHRAGRAIDFRIRGVQLREVRDYLWRTFREVGIGWYPYEGFIHMDSRPDEHDIAWTFFDGDNHYNPYWAELARAPKPATPPQPHKPGV